MALEIHFENCVSIRAPVPGLLVTLAIDVELVKKGLGITLVLCGQKASLEILSDSQLIVDVSLAWWVSPSSVA